MLPKTGRGRIRRKVDEMRIGILTFHSQLNYGGVLQCWTLQTALENAGHKVFVIDRWLDRTNIILERGYDKFGFRQWIRFIICSALGLGNLGRFLRVRRTKRFIHRFLKLTPFHFVDWKDAPQDIGVDVIVVGSDQVWHCGNFGDPRPYLLENAPPIPAIAYAASFGMAAIPQYVFSKTDDVEAEPIYRRCMGRFKAISCREAEGVRLCKEFGANAEHVVDPTLLLDAEDWKPLVDRVDCEARRKPCLVCYFLSEDIEKAVELLEVFAKARKCCVKVFVNYGKDRLLPFPSSRIKAKTWLKGMEKRILGDVMICASAGPKEFVRAIADATWVVSDSFHALMFSIVFKKNVRILKPQTESRRQMFARIVEFAGHANGPLVVDSVSAALDSIEKGERVEFDYRWLGERIRESQCWLQANLK